MMAETFFWFGAMFGSFATMLKNKGWPKGPWDDEPDKEQFYHRGVPCLIVRTPMGALCGYAGVYPGHPWYEKDYDDVAASAHGGLTYSGKCDGDICHSPKEGEPPVWWFGFDCAHYGDGDVVPGLWLDGEYRNIDYVREECRRLADQILRCARAIDAQR